MTEWTDEQIVKQYAPLIKELVNSPWPDKNLLTREGAISIVRQELERQKELPWGSNEKD